MFRVKICGITNPEDALAAAAAGADALGLNFFSASPRCVSLETAARIAEAAPSGILKVGVFVNATLSTIRRTADLCRLDAVQLHGDEPLELLMQLEPLPVLRVLRLAAGEGLALRRRWDELSRCARPPVAVLVDAASAQYGGSGQPAAWDEIPPPQSRPPLPLILAGGLRPDNVGRAVCSVRPQGVDVASGVESSPGRKDVVRMAAFIRQALAVLEPT